MARQKLPSYRLHKASGQAIVQYKGKRTYLGKFGSEASYEAYRRFCLQLTAKRRAREAVERLEPSEGVCVAQVMVAYLGYAQGYYVKDGKPTSEVDSIRQALRFLKPWASTLVDHFGPRELEDVREVMLAYGRPGARAAVAGVASKVPMAEQLEALLAGTGRRVNRPMKPLSRDSINRYVHAIRRMFKWATSKGLVDVAVYQRLCTVAALRKGRTEAPEPEPVGPVADDVVEKTLAHVPAIVADMVRLQRLTGMRPGELVILRPCDVTRGVDGVWTYHPSTHKTEHHERARKVFLGPQAQAILTPYLEREPEAFCFSPKESEAQRREEQRAKRKTKLTPSQRARRPKRFPKRATRDRYNVDIYRRAITRGARRAGVDVWSPNQLRHSAATELRARYGLEAAKVILGHSELETSQIYAEKDELAARKIAKEVG